MSRERWLVSALLLYHLAAVTVHQLPSPRSLLPVTEIRSGSGSGADAWLTSLLVPLLDRAAAAAAPVERYAYAFTEPLRRVTQPYVSAGLRQYWAMFANPEARRNYVRLDYHVAAGGDSGERVERELVFPAGREDRTRVMPDFLEKAGFTALESFHYPDVVSGVSAKGNELIPMIRYFRTRFQAAHLEPGERVTRTDLWYGFAPISSSSDTADTTLRLAVLRDYYGGPQPPASSRSGNRGDQEQEADIVWKLEFIDTP